MKHDAIAVIDFGGQYAHLIATKVRRQQIFAEIRQPEDPTEVFRRYKGVIISGSPALSSQGEDSDYNKEIYDLDIPILGLCFGHQEMAKHYGGTVVHGGREWGCARMHLSRGHPLFEGLGPTEQVWMSHFDSVSSLGPDFEELGYTQLADGGPVHRYAAIGSDKLRRYGFQFHAEVDDTINGDEMIANFARNICGCRPTWSMGAYADEVTRRIQKDVGDNSVFLLASGGVDSTVAAKLFANALGPDRVRLLHIDNGLMRKNESSQVIEMFRELGLDSHLHFVDASVDFLRALEGEVAPEKKREIIGNTFVEVFNREAKRLGIERYLFGQGTIYPDTIETGGTRRSDVIKTHHNRVPVINRMIAEGRVVEPLVDLYKVEVRELGERLGVPHDLIWRHPFPGPGLGVRLLCSRGDEADGATPQAIEQVAKIASKFRVDGRILPIRSVGVKADLRAYEHPVILSGHSTWDRMIEAAGSILKEVSGINRCIWSLGATISRDIDTLPATVTRERLDLLREADDIVMNGLSQYGIYHRIWQCPTVLAPVRIGNRGSELCIIRPVHSERAMTASAARLPNVLLNELNESISALPGISAVAVDLTSKPPGTIEWE